MSESLCENKTTYIALFIWQKVLTCTKERKVFGAEFPEL
jgi:hypothetical protein